MGGVIFVPKLSYKPSYWGGVVLKIACGKDNTYQYVEMKCFSDPLGGLSIVKK